jgi:hypothetical protein
MSGPPALHNILDPLRGSLRDATVVPHAGPMPQDAAP